MATERERKSAELELQPPHTHTHTRAYTVTTGVKGVTQVSRDAPEERGRSVKERLPEEEP